VPAGSCMPQFNALIVSLNTTVITKKKTKHGAWRDPLSSRSEKAGSKSTPRIAVDPRAV
jgi:hypothetical protein